MTPNTNYSLEPDLHDVSESAIFQVTRFYILYNTINDKVERNCHIPAGNAWHHQVRQGFPYVSQESVYKND